MKNIFSNSKTLLTAAFGLVSIIFMTSTTSCSEKRENLNPERITAQNARSVSSNKNQIPVAAAQTDTVLKYKPDHPIRYKAIATRKVKSFSALKEKYGEEGAKLILALNRVDEKDFRKSDTLIVPDVIGNILTYSPFPYVIEAARPIPKLILISRKIQAIGAYENGMLVRWGPTSTGRKSKPTPEGLFSMNWKAKKTTSTIDSSWILPFYFNFNNKEGVALHQFDMPGYPASHACVRLLEGDAKWFYYWAEQWMLADDGSFAAHGTPVIVFDEYGWGKRRPWRSFLENPYGAVVSQTEIDSLMNKYLAQIKERSEKRLQLVDEIKRKKAEKEAWAKSVKTMSVDSLPLSPQPQSAEVKKMDSKE
ncbi:MAG: L,D-transpeptidase [Bacillota bacterium]